MKPEHYVIGAIFSVLITALGFMLKAWKQGWDTRIAAQDRRLDVHDNRHNEHDVNHAKVSKDLEHIKENVEETNRDVKELLKQNGRRSAP